MANKPLLHCRLCNEPLARDEEYEEHLLHQHDPNELANEIACEWEADELGAYE